MRTSSVKEIRGVISLRLEGMINNLQVARGEN